MNGSILLALSLLAGPAGAQFRPLETVAPGTVPGGINYQGRLEEQGALVNGQRVVRLRLYDAASGGNLLWDGGDMNVNAVDGVFAAVLNIPISALTSAGGKYMESEVEGILLSPREPLRSVPYAKVAETVQGSIEISSGSLDLRSAFGDLVYASSATGQVGIGSQAFPSAQAKLFISGGDLVLENPTMAPASADPDLFVPGNMAVDGSLAGGSAGNRFEKVTVAAALNAGLHFQVGAGTLAVPTSGRLGLGTTSPSADLDIQADAGPGWILGHATEPRLDLQLAGAALGRLSHDGSVGRAGTVGPAPFRLQPNGGDVLNLTPGGDVGIGVTNPGSELEAAGDVNATGALTLGTELSVSSGGTGANTAAGARAALGLLATDGSNVTAGFPTFAVQISSTAERMRRFQNDPADCPGGGFPAGIDERGDVQGCADPAASLDTAEGVNEARIYDAGNALSAPWAVTSTLHDIRLDAADDTLYIDVSGNNVGIGAAPGAGDKLDVAGRIDAADFIESGGNTLGNGISGNAATASALGANGANCGAGNAPAGVDQAGAAEGCFDVAAQTEGDGHFNGTNVHGAASANTVDRIVLRDGAGNFAAGTITAGLTGNAATMTAFAADPADCGAGQTLRGISADGTAVCATETIRTEADVEGAAYDSGNALAGAWAVASGGNDIHFDSPDNTFYVDESANSVGIGTNAPASALQVSGTLTASASTLTSTGGNVPNNCTRRTSAGGGATATQACNAGEIVLGGGGSCLASILKASYPASGTSWEVSCSVTTVDVYAICCRE